MQINNRHMQGIWKRSLAKPDSLPLLVWSQEISSQLVIPSYYIIVRSNLLVFLYSISFFSAPSECTRERERELSVYTQPCLLEHTIILSTRVTNDKGKLMPFCIYNVNRRKVQ